MGDNVMAVTKTSEDIVTAPSENKGDAVQVELGPTAERNLEDDAVNMAALGSSHGELSPGSQPQSVLIKAQQEPLVTVPSSVDASLGDVTVKPPVPEHTHAECLQPQSAPIIESQPLVQESSLDMEGSNPITLDITYCNQSENAQEIHGSGAPELSSSQNEEMKTPHSSKHANSVSNLLNCLGESSSGNVMDDNGSSSQLLISSMFSITERQVSQGSRPVCSRSVSPSPVREDSREPRTPNKYVRRGSASSNASSVSSNTSSRAWAKLQKKASAFKKDDLLVGQSRSTPGRCEGTFTVHASDVAPIAEIEKIPASAEIQQTVQAERQRLAKNVSSRAYDNDRHKVAGEKKLMSIVPQSDDNISTTSDVDKLREKYLGAMLPIKWALTGLSAIAIALEAGMIILGSHDLVVGKLALVEVLCDSGTGGQVLAYLFFLAVAFGLSFMAALLVTYVAPHAGGGGIPEVIAHLNGVEMPQAFTFTTWLCRSVGLIAVTSAGVFAGPEGPFVHIGGLVAVGMLRGPKFRGRLLWTPCLQGHRNRCEYISQGAAMGVAAAFGAPIGGVLFSLEEASTYWNSNLTWRTFFGCSVAAVLAKFAKTGFKKLSMTGFIEFPDIDAGFEPWELCMFLILAIVTGVIGGVFCVVVGRIGKWRRVRYSLGSPSKNSKRDRVVEVMVIAFLTITVCFWLPIIVGCRPLQDNVADVHGQVGPDFSGGICAKDEYSDIGYILLQPKEEAVKALFSRSLSGGAKFEISSLLVCFLVIYLFTLMTFGSAIPCGLFIPNILSGACLGRVLGEVLLIWELDIHPGVYALMGSAGMLAGFSRMTIALTMIMLEITNNMKMLMPLLVTILVSKFVADSIAVGVNHQVLHLNPNVHLLADALSEDHMLVIEGLTAHDLCLSEVVFLHEQEPIGQIMSLLLSTSFEGYPVIGSGRRLLGFVPRVNLANAVASYNPKDGTLMNILKLASAAPEITPWNTPLARAYHHFRSSGLQRLCVVDEGNELIGLLTRTDFARLCKHGKEGVEEIRMLINRKHAKIAAGMMGSDTPKGPRSEIDSDHTPPSSARSREAKTKDDQDQDSTITPPQFVVDAPISEEDPHRTQKILSPLSMPPVSVPTRSIENAGRNDQMGLKVSSNSDSGRFVSESSSRDRSS